MRSGEKGLRAYFEPEALVALGDVFREAKAILERRGENTPENLDQTAKRILDLASRGLSPCLILVEVEAGISHHGTRVANS